MFRKTTVLLAALLISLFTLSIVGNALTVYDIVAGPNPLVTYTYFTATTSPSNYELDVIEIKVYNLASQLVATIPDEDVYRIRWTGGNLANGVYYYYAWFYNYDAGEIDTATFGPYQLVINK
jgi:hypothetical protein